MYHGLMWLPWRSRKRWMMGILGLIASVSLLGVSDGIHPALGTPIQFASVTMKSRTVGWGIDHHDQLLHTVNGGRTWTTVTPSGVILETVMPMVNNRTRVTVPLPPHNTVVWYESGSVAETMTLLSRTGVVQINQTDNGGHQWHRWTADLTNLIAGSVSDPILKQIEFVNANDGWILIGPAHSVLTGMGYVGMELWHTTTGGHTWMRVDESPRASESLFGPISFTNRSTGWMIQEKGTDSRFLLHTTNGGHTWSHVLLRQTEVDGTPIFHGAFGILFVDNPKPEVMASKDFGQHWGRPQRLPLVKSRDAAFGVASINPRILWEVTGDTWMRSEDAGQRWTEQKRTETFPPDATALELDMLNRHVGWIWDLAADGSSILASTTNGGRTWKSWTPTLVPSS